MELSLLKEGLIVMIIGMGTVFVFLTIMIWAMNVTAHLVKFIGKHFPEKVEASPQRKIKESNNEEIAIAIACTFREIQA